MAQINATTMTTYESLQDSLKMKPRSWLITGVAGFIGCNLLETLLGLGQRVVGVDNFATGYKHNLDFVRDSAGTAAWANFRFIEASIENPESCRQAVHGVDYVLHQAALGSVSRSIHDPVATNRSNVDGFLNMLVATRDAGKRFVYASSSSVYGDHPELPKIEDRTGRPLSPYAVTKLVNEHYAEVFGRTYGMQSIGLRYFNVFGPHQDPAGVHAAVIPKWTAAMLNGEPVRINGDGETSRDFCYMANAIQANLLAATTENPEAVNQTYNIAVGECTSLNQLYALMKSMLRERRPHLNMAEPLHCEFRDGDVRHSLADIGKARSILGYDPSHTIAEGMSEMMAQLPSRS